MARPNINEPKVLRAMNRAPGHFCPSDIAEFLGMGVNTAASVFGRLLMREAIVFVGTAADAGRSDLRSNTKLYGIKGSPRIATTGQPVPMSYEERLRMPPPNRGFEFRPLMRDPFEKMKLAMLTRR